MMIASVSRYVYILNGGVVCWKNFKQHTMANFTYEVKYIVTFNTVKEAVWL